MFNLFPFTNFHDLNMDWILKNIKSLWSKAVFTVNNTEPDENGNVNLPGVSGVTSVNGIGADGSGNIQVVGKSTLVGGEITANTEKFTGTGAVYYNMGFVSVRAEGTIKAGTQTNDVLFTISSNIPEKLYSVYLFAVGTDTHMIYPLYIAQSTGEVKSRMAFAEDTRILLYQVYETYPVVTVPIVAP